MSLHSLLAHWTEKGPDALAALSPERAAEILAALPRASTLDPDTHADAVQVAACIAAVRLSLGHPVADSIGYGWTAALGEARRYPSVALDSDTLDPYAETYPDRTTLTRSATYSPDAAYRWTESDTLTVALSLVSERSRDLFDVVSAAPGETYWGDLPERDTLAALAALAGVRLSPRTARRECADALAEIRGACGVVVDWISAARARDYWTESAETLAETLAATVSAALDCRGISPETGTGYSGPASDVVIRYRDTLSDAWRIVTRTETETVVTVDPETVTETETETESRTLHALTDSNAAEILADPYTLAAYSRTWLTREADAYAERLARTAGAARKSRSRKGSRVGSTGPTVPIGSRSGSGGSPLGLALGTFTVHPVAPIAHPVIVRDAATESRLAARMADAARLAARDAALLADPVHVARIESATDRARAAALALSLTDKRDPHPAPVTYGPSRAEWETHRARA